LAAVISGMSHSTMAKAEVVVDAADADASLIPFREEMDRTGKVTPAYQAVLKAQGKISTRQRSVLTPPKPPVPVEETIYRLVTFAKRLGQFTRADFYDKRSGTLINEKKCERCMVNLIAAKCFLEAIAVRLGNILADPLGKATDKFGNRRHSPESQRAEDT
jgi:hypothetical protein